MDPASLGLPLLVGLIAVALAVRLPERAARRRQLDRHHRLDPRAAGRATRWSGRRSSTSSPSCSSACTSPRRWARGSSRPRSSIRRGDLRRARWARSSGTSSPGWLGIPSSSLARADRRACGRGRRQGGLRRGGLGRVSARRRPAIVVSPLLGFVAGAGAGAGGVLDLRARRAALRSTSTFRRLQFVSAALYSLGHGGNDAQKTMGIIAVLLYSHGLLGGEFHVPFWVVLSCQAAMALGTLLGGWRIVHTMGSKITRLIAAAGLLRRDRRGDHPVPGHLPRRAGLDHPHHHRRHRRRRRGPAGLRGALERGQQHRLGLDRDPAGDRGRRALFYWLARAFA